MAQLRFQPDPGPFCRGNGSCGRHRPKGGMHFQIAHGRFPEEKGRFSAKTGGFALAVSIHVVDIVGLQQKAVARLQFGGLPVPRPALPGRARATRRLRSEPALPGRACLPASADRAFLRHWRVRPLATAASRLPGLSTSPGFLAVAPSQTRPSAMRTASSTGFCGLRPTMAKRR